MFYSLIIPVYNRPEDIEDLLACLVKQTYTNFEILIIESGSSIKSDKVVESYKDKLNISYHFKGNDGQGFSRNYGMARAKGDYFVILDSDILLDDSYLENLNQSLKTNYVDAFGGPDKAHNSFTLVQKAVDYCMTSMFTTGGTRGNEKSVGKFYPRSFNMGFSREVYEKTNGFKYPYFGEDIELSKRIMSLGFKTGLIPSAYIYHKRKRNFRGFYKQMFFFGRARIQIYKLFPDTLSLAHFFPTAFTLYVLLTILLIVISPCLGLWTSIPLFLYLIIIFLGGTMRFKNPVVGLIAAPAAVTQMFGYGLGFLKDFIRRVIFKKEPINDN